MIKGECVLRAIGSSKEDFPNFAVANIELFDSNGKVETDESFKIEEFLFMNNIQSEAKFLRFLRDFEKSPYSCVLNLAITEKCVIVNYKTDHAIAFSRQP